MIIIGGGPSLKNFPWDVLIPENTIGCNAAFRLGAKVCSVVLFGDYKSFYLKFESELKKFDGPVYSVARRLFSAGIPWLHVLPQRPQGMHLDAIGWNGNTGAAAINFAIASGARKVYLLGFDMSNCSNDTHWHEAYDHRNQRGHPQIQNYPRFLLGFQNLVADWHGKFADREIINVTDRSGLTCFPCIPVADFLKERSTK